MSVITISRGCYSRGKEVASKVAQRLGYTCISRELLIKSSGEFNVPEIKLRRALHDAPSVFDRFTYGKERYIAYVQSTLLDLAAKDNLIYHGLAGHFILSGIKHMLSVRILANLEDRIRLEMEQENVSREKAFQTITKDDHERRQWSLKIYGVDTWDPNLYDLVLHIDKITTDDAANIICSTVDLPQFRTTPESQRYAEDLAMAAKVKARLMKLVPSASVTASQGAITVNASVPLTEEVSIAEELEDLCLRVPGVRDVKVHVVPFGVYD